MAYCQVSTASGALAPHLTEDEDTNTNTLFPAGYEDARHWKHICFVFHCYSPYWWRLLGRCCWQTCLCGSLLVSLQRSKRKSILEMKWFQCWVYIMGTIITALRFWGNIIIKEENKVLKGSFSGLNRYKSGPCFLLSHYYKWTILYINRNIF